MQRYVNWLLLAALLPGWAALAEPAASASAIDLSLPVHQKPKLHPELADPVLGDQAQIVEWAWSPQYAERFGLQPQADGLPNGGLWLVGVKIERNQVLKFQRYTCHILGLMDNKLSILTPPGEQYTVYPIWQGGVPGQQAEIPGSLESVPGYTSWEQIRANKPKKKLAVYGMTTPYLTFIRNYKTGLAYFDLLGSCSTFRDAENFRGELSFPTQFTGKEGKAAFDDSAVKFDLPVNLLRRIYPYAVDANDWTSCLLRRAGDKTDVLTLRASKSKRFGNICEPVTGQPK